MWHPISPPSQAIRDQNYSRGPTLTLKASSLLLQITFTYKYSHTEQVHLSSTTLTCKSPIKKHSANNNSLRGIQSFCTFAQDNHSVSCWELCTDWSEDSSVIFAPTHNLPLSMSPPFFWQVVNPSSQKAKVYLWVCMCWKHMRDPDAVHLSFAY